MATRENFIAEVTRQIDRAYKQGRPHAELNAGEVHRIVGGYPPHSHKMPSLCKVMRVIEHPVVKSKTIVFEPPSGQGASLTIRYSFSQGEKRMKV